MATFYPNCSPLNLPPCQSLLSCGPVKTPLQSVIQPVQLGHSLSVYLQLYRTNTTLNFFLSEVKKCFLLDTGSFAAAEWPCYDIFSFPLTEHALNIRKSLQKIGRLYVCVYT